MSVSLFSALHYSVFNNQDSERGPNNLRLFGWQLWRERREMSIENHLSDFSFISKVSGDPTESRDVG